MHCTLYTYQAKQRMFQNIFHFSYFANLKSDSKPKLPTHNIKYFMYLLFEGCVVFQQLPPPLASLNYSHKRTMTSLGVLGQTKSHWLIQSVPSNHLSSKNIQIPKLSNFQRKWKCFLTFQGVCQADEMVMFVNRWMRYLPISIKNYFNILDLNLPTLSVSLSVSP